MTASGESVTAAYPAPRTARAWVYELGAGRRAIVVAWILSRIVVLASAALVQVAGWPVRAGWRPGFGRHPFALLGIWDGHWYRAVADHGYLLVPGHRSDPAFFPLLPVLMRGLHGIGLSLNAGGLLLADLGFLAGLLALYELGREWLPEPDARRAAVLAAFFPFGFVFSMVYPEGLALAALALAGVWALRRRWLLCAACAAAAALARPQGVFVALPIAAAALAGWPELRLSERARAVTAVLAGPAALASVYAYYGWALGDPLAWSKAELGWGRSFAVSGVARSFRELGGVATHHHSAWLVRDVVFGVVYLACLVVAARGGVPRAWIVAGLAMVLLPLGSGSFTSDARFGLLALPVYFGLALLARDRRLYGLIRFASPALLAAGVVTIWLKSP